MMKSILVAFALSIVASACAAQDAPARAQANHPFTKVQIAYRSQDCSFQFSPVDFCDEKHMGLINAAISDQAPNFNQHYILLLISEWPKYHQRSVAAVDTNTGIVYPLPIDAYAGRLNKKGSAEQDGKVTFALDSNKVCIDGSILVYKATEEGNFCFDFQGDRFVGHHTTYMD